MSVRPQLKKISRLSFARVWSWFAAPSSKLTDPGERRQAQLLMVFALTIGLGIGAVLILTMNYPNIQTFQPTLLFLIGDCLFTYLTARSRYFKIGSMALCGGISACGYALVYYGAGQPDAMLLATVPLALIMGSVLLPVWSMVFLALVNVAATAAVVYFSRELDLVTGSIVMGVYFAMGVLLVINKVYHSYVEKARVAEVQGVNLELKSFQTVLEEQIAERTQNVEAVRREAVAAREEAETARRIAEEQAWQAEGQALLGERMRGELDLQGLAAGVVKQICLYLGAPVGALFVAQGDLFRLVASHAYTRRKHTINQFKMGEGLVGQAALEKLPLILTRVPADYLSISSGLVEVGLKSLVVTPLIYNDRTVGVLELGSMAELTAQQMEFLQKAAENIAVAVNTTQARTKINELLSETRSQAEALQAREDQLRRSNGELEVQAERLRASEGRLREKQGELEMANGELMRKASALEASSAALQEQKALLDQQNQELERKAEELSLASKYKSEFLANMSHELRTPLNSLLILARMLANNDGGNLTTDQIKSAQVIYNSGTDLLNLINEILDLSKVEAGRMEFHFAPMPIEDLIQAMRAQFAHVAQEKGLEFQVVVDEEMPATIETDEQRVKQIIKNLLSNAFKFTDKGSVQLRIARPRADDPNGCRKLDPKQAVGISVIDTGIGMKPEQQKVVFEAFRQADGSTSRKYGGTGLGLTISREMAARMGGEIGLQSEFGQGSMFTLYLPLRHSGASGEVKAAESAARVAAPVAAPSTPLPPPSRPANAPPPPPVIADDRDSLVQGDKVLLIVEDDTKFAGVVRSFARAKGFKCLVAGDGESGFHLAQTYQPKAIILDLNLPGMNGWQVLDALKQTPETRHIPVHIISAMDGNHDAGKRGAVGFITKPVTLEGLDGVFHKIEEMISRKVKNLLLVEDDVNLRQSFKTLLSGGDVVIAEAGTGKEALSQLATQPFDCMILDLTLPDMTGFELLNQLDADRSIHRCPIIVCTGKDLTEAESRELMKHADSIVIKGVKSQERLLDETALFLHRVVAEMPEDKQSLLKKQLHAREGQLEGKHILVVDDDMRNAFALSKLLGEKGVDVAIAHSGIKALEVLETRPEIDLVLMDIMMPGMDGYEAIQRIRAQVKFRNLPILALTAKAMKGDADKCIAAGASDYLSKPVDVDRLFSMLRVWLYK